jgi:hypothetical protein
MLREGPIPAVVHGAWEYSVALLFVAAPFLFGFDGGTTIAVCIVSGLIMLAFTASSDLPTGLVKQIKPPIHATVDLVLALVLVAAPFFFGFRTQESGALALFIVVGVAHLLITIGTRFPLPPPSAEGRWRGFGRGGGRSDAVEP